jgi:hypothetical protein
MRLNTCQLNSVNRASYDHQSALFFLLSFFCSTVNHKVSVFLSKVWRYLRYSAVIGLYVYTIWIVYTSWRNTIARVPHSDSL